MSKIFNVQLIKYIYTYGEITIKNALANTTEFYTPMGMKPGDMDFNDLHTRLPEFRPESNRRYRGNDLGNGRLFADIFKFIRLLNIADGNMTVCELVDRYLKTKTGVREGTRTGYVTVQRILAKESFGQKKIRTIKTSDAKLFLIKLQQEDGKGYSTIHNIRGVLRPAFQMAVDDDILVKNPFGFQLVGVVVNDSVTREAISREQMRKFLKFVHDDVCYCKYYEVVYILFHTGMRISEFCGLTLKDIDLENRTVNIDHQLQRTCDMRYIIEETKTEAGKRKIPITEDVAMMFQAIIEDKHYTSCLPPYLLLQYGKIGNESKDSPIPYGTFGHQCYDECVYAYQL